MIYNFNFFEKYQSEALIFYKKIIEICFSVWNNFFEKYQSEALIFYKKIIDVSLETKNNFFERDLEENYAVDVDFIFFQLSLL